MSSKVHAFTDDALGEDDATAIADLIKHGKLNPLEVTEAAIARAQKVNAVLNAIEVPAFDAAIYAARTPVSQGAFAGVPTFIKDNADLGGFPTRNGSRAFTAKIAAKHGDYTEQYLALGFNVLGKSALPEFGFNASTEFAGEHPTRNPWNTDYSAGGSSGGSAALVAAGVVPIAHANDGGGSIRVPAACCGLVGLKPTRSRHRNNSSANSMPVNIVSEGVVTRSVRDTARFHAAMENVYKNPQLKPIGHVEGPSKKKLRIGLVIDSINGHATCAETRKVVEDTAKLMESLGHSVEAMPLPIPKTFIADFTLYWSMLAFLLGTFGKFVLAPDFDAAKLDPFSRGLVEHYKKHIFSTPMMLYRMYRSAELYAQVMKDYDAVLSPVLGHTVPKLGHLNPETPFETLFERLTEYVAFTPLNNAAGSPAISLPMGMSKAGLPIAVQFQAAHGEERTLLEIGFMLEGVKPFKKIQDRT